MCSDLWIDPISRQALPASFGELLQLTSLTFAEGSGPLIRLPLSGYKPILELPLLKAFKLQFVVPCGTVYAELTGKYLHLSSLGILNVTQWQQVPSSIDLAALLIWLV